MRIIYKVASRFRFAVRAASLHLLISIAISSILSVLVFQIWFPAPFRELSGGLRIFWVLFCIDIVCGPLLTLILFNPYKTKIAWRVDISLIIFFQIAALGYGIYVLGNAKPLAIVYEVDRFRIIAYADLADDELTSLPFWVSKWGFASPRVLATRMAETSEEKLASVNASLQGVEPSQRPSAWQDYSLALPMVLARAQTLEKLRKNHPSHEKLINSVVRKIFDKHGIGGNSLIWLPLVSRTASDWVVILEPKTGEILDYVHLDGFFE